MRKLKGILRVVLGFTLVSCGSFLEEYPEDLIYVKSVSDLSELLVGEGYMMTQKTDNLTVDGKTTIKPWIHVMDDDAVQYMSSMSMSRIDYLGIFSKYPPSQKMMFNFKLPASFLHVIFL